MFKFIGRMFLFLLSVVIVLISIAYNLGSRAVLVGGLMYYSSMAVSYAYDKPEFLIPFNICFLFNLFVAGFIKYIILGHNIEINKAIDLFINNRPNVEENNTTTDTNE